MRRRRERRAKAQPADRKTVRKQQEQLDEAVEETFPASDPISVSGSTKEEEWTPEELAEAERKHRQPPKGG